MLEQLGQAPTKTKRILEVNPSHPLLQKLHAIFAANSTDARLEQCAKLLFGQAHLAESGTLPDLGAFSQALTEVMLRAT
jgi:molecular chaperone HtpG